jgi:hypothetical protein
MDYRVELTSEDPSRTPHGAEMRQRLADPVEREKLRLEHREHLRSLYPELAESLGVDPSVEEKILDIHTDQQMAHLERFWGSAPDPLRSAGSMTDHLAAQREMNERENQTKQRIRELLGADGYNRYLDYTDSLRERGEVAYFQRHLPAEDKLSASQKQQMMSHLRAQHDAGLVARRLNLFGRFDGGPPRGPADLTRRNVEANEDLFRCVQRDSRDNLEIASSILTPSQFAVYEKLEQRKVDGQRRHVQQMRVQAGMSPEFDENKPPAAPVERTPLHCRVRLELKITIDNEAPASIDVTLDNATPGAGFQASQALWAVPTATLYEDGWAQLNIDYYEDRGGERRRVQNGTTVGALTKYPDNRPIGALMGLGTLHGSKVYMTTLNWKLTRAL